MLHSSLNLFLFRTNIESQLRHFLQKKKTSYKQEITNKVNKIQTSTIISGMKRDRTIGHKSQLALLTPHSYKLINNLS